MPFVIDPAGDYQPSPEDVAAVLTARTFNDSSEEEGEFTDTTRPTEVQVERLIERSAEEVRARIGQEVFETTNEFAFLYAKQLVSIRAAMWVELSYFPEQTTADESAYEALRIAYEQGLAALIDSLPDTSTTKKGFYSIRTRPEVGGVLEEAEA